MNSGARLGYAISNDFEHWNHWVSHSPWSRMAAADGWKWNRQSLSVRVVLSDGKVTQASADENNDLFWAIRGAGHNFGMITEITEKIHQVIDPQQGKDIRVG